MCSIYVNVWYIYNIYTTHTRVGNDRPVYYEQRTTFNVCSVALSTGQSFRRDKQLKYVCNRDTV